MQEYEKVDGGLLVHPTLFRFIAGEALPGSGLDPEAFWSGFAALVHDLAPRNITVNQAPTLFESQR